MGNTFLKNFVSVYDFDQQQVRLGVNVHSEKLAKAYPFKKSMLKNLKTLPPTPKEKASDKHPKK